MLDLRRVGIFRDLSSRESVLRMMQRHRLMSQRKNNLRFLVHTSFRGDRVTMNNFGFTVIGGSGRECKGFKISKCWD